MESLNVGPAKLCFHELGFFFFFPSYKQTYVYFSISVVSCSGLPQELLYKRSQKFALLSVSTASRWQTPWRFPQAVCVYVSNRECSLRACGESKPHGDQTVIWQTPHDCLQQLNLWQIQGNLLLFAFKCNCSPQGQCLKNLLVKNPYLGHQCQNSSFLFLQQ